jgi:hypothetical protein
MSNDHQISNELREEIIKFTKNINQLKTKLDQPGEYIYEECLELKRLVQLEIEELILNIKISNNIDINVDDHLIEHLDVYNSSIKKIKRKHELLITRIEAYEKEVREQLNNCEYDRDDRLNYVYDECRELERIIQLETEQKLQNHLFNQVNQDIMEESIYIISKINQYENEEKSYWNTKEANLIEYNILKKQTDFHIQNWSKSLGELDDNHIKQASIKMKEYSKRLDIINDEIKINLFNTNHSIQLKHLHDQNKKNHLNIDFKIKKILNLNEFKLKLFEIIHQ